MHLLHVDLHVRFDFAGFCSAYEGMRVSPVQEQGLLFVCLLALFEQIILRINVKLLALNVQLRIVAYHSVLGGCRVLRLVLTSVRVPRLLTCHVLLLTRPALHHILIRLENGLDRRRLLKVLKAWPGEGRVGRLNSSSRFRVFISHQRFTHLFKIK